MAQVNSYEKDIIEAARLVLPWSKLSGSNILITGSTGLIGSCLIDLLMNNKTKDYKIYAAGRNEYRAKRIFSDYIKDQDFYFLKYDVTKPLECDINFDYIIHAASNASPIYFAEKPVEVMKANLIGVINLIEYGRVHEMKRFLYVSSGEIYGEANNKIIKEHDYGYVDCMNPRSCYPSSKRAAETLCISYYDEYDVDIVIARPTHIYGPKFPNSDNRVYAQFINNILNNENIIMKSEGKQFRSWCYVVDCASAILYILLKGISGEAYNISDSNSNLTIKQLAELIAKIGNKKVTLSLPSDAEKKAFNPVTNSIFDITKLKELGWCPRNNIEQNMRNSIEFLLKQKNIKNT